MPRSMGNEETKDEVEDRENAVGLAEKVAGRGGRNPNRTVSQIEVEIRGKLRLEVPDVDTWRERRNARYTCRCWYADEMKTARPGMELSETVRVAATRYAVTRGGYAILLNALTIMV